MADEKFYVTKEGLDELLKEQDNLIHVPIMMLLVTIRHV